MRDTSVQWMKLKITIHYLLRILFLNSLISLQAFVHVYIWMLSLFLLPSPCLPLLSPIGHLCHPKETIFVCVERSSETPEFISLLFRLARWSVGGGAGVQTRGPEFPSRSQEGAGVN